MKKQISVILIIFAVIFVVAASFCLGWIASALTAGDKTANEIGKVSESAFLIEVYDAGGERKAFGTAFCAGDYLVTAQHVVKDMVRATLTAENGRTYEVNETVFEDDVSDVALLKKPKGCDAPSLALNEKTKKGEAVFTVGCPEGFTNLASRGTLSGFWDMGDFERIIFTAPVSEGSSGSPLCSEDGRVIGIVTSKYTDKEGLNIATSIADVIRAMDSVKEG